MNKRLKVHEFLTQTINCSHVYYQPPENIKMVYPAIVYTLIDISNYCSGGGIYLQLETYKITLITKEVDSDLFNTMIAQLSLKFQTPFVSDNLHHYVFNMVV